MTDDLPDTLAAELALGVVDGDDRAGALRRMLAEPTFAAEVERWRTEFATLFDAVPAVEPGPALFDRIEASLAPRAAPARRNLFWPSLAGLSSIAAAALLVVTLNRPTPAPLVQAPVAQATVVQPPTTLLAAAITPLEKGEPLSAIYDPSAGTLRLGAAALADARHSAELWVIGVDGVPHSLGLLQTARATALPVALADRRRLLAAAVLAVSIEPVGGSPTGQPTGPVVAKGVLTLT